MATEPQKICSSTPKKEKRKFATVDLNIPVITIVDTALTCNIDPNNPMRAILPSNLKDSDLQLKAVRVKDSEVIIHIQKAIDNQCLCKTYHASISHDLNMIYTNCIVTLNVSTLDMQRYYDKGNLPRTLTLAIITVVGQYIDFIHL